MTRVISFSSGKGGVGKSSLVVNLGSVWAKQGKRVLLIDGDWSLGKLSLMLDARPNWTIEKVINGEIGLIEAIHQIGPNLSMLASPSGLIGFEEMDEKTRNHLFFEFENLKGLYDYILIDHSSGINWGVLQFAAASHQHVIVTTCEPTSYTDAYAIIKILSKRFHIREFFLVVTMSQQLAETERIISRFAEVAWSQLGIRIGFTEILPWESKVHESIKKRQPYVTLYPSLNFTERLEKLANRLVEAPLMKHLSGGLKFFVDEQFSR